MALTGCTSAWDWDRAPVRNVAYNPYVLSDSIPVNPAGDRGFAYRPPRRVIRSRVVTHHVIVHREVVHKSVVPLQR